MALLSQKGSARPREGGSVTEFPGKRRPPLEDRALVDQVLDGDHSAFEALMARYGPIVAGYLAKRARSDHEDILQEVFLSAYHNLGTLRQRDRFGPWLMRIARTKLIDFQRGNARRIGSQGNIEDVQASSSPTVDDSLVETRNIVTETIAEMPDKYRDILYLRLIDEEPPSRIAQQLGMNESSVRSRLLRGLGRLRKALRQRGITGS